MWDLTKGMRGKKFQKYLQKTLLHNRYRAWNLPQRTANYITWNIKVKFTLTMFNNIYNIV